MKQYLVAVSDADALCGVEAFSRHLARELKSRAKVHVLSFDIGALSRALDPCEGLILNFPVVAWKKHLFEPLLAAVMTKLKRKSVTIILHEWASLNWKRRLALWPVVLLADAILFSAPEIRRELRSSRLWTSPRVPSALIPIPPNIAVHATYKDNPAALKIREQGRLGRTVIGQFGSIYPKKNCGELLKVAQALVIGGHDVAVVFIGSFIKGRDNVEADFYRQVEEYGLAGRVLVTGYLATDCEIFAAFAEVEVFCYRFEEGLTSRRGSVLAAAASGRTVVTNAPQETKALDHHRLFQSLIANGNIIICSHDADIDAMAAAVAKSVKLGPPPPKDFNLEIAHLWKDVVVHLDAVQR